MAHKKQPQSELAELEEEHRHIRRNFRFIAALTAVVLLSGAIFYHNVESLSWVNAIYFCTITLATVGYGDIVPHTDTGKIFTIFYVLIGIGIIATFANLLLKNSRSRQEIRQFRRRKPDTDDGSLHSGINLD